MISSLVHSGRRALSCSGRRTVSSTTRGSISPWASAPALDDIMSAGDACAVDEAAAQCETLKLWMDEEFDGVAHVQLARPDKMNAANMRMWWELQHAFDAIDRDERARAAVLSAQGSAFCSGMDLSVFAQMQRADQSEACPARASEQLARLVGFLQDSCTALERCRVPVLAYLDRRGHIPHQPYSASSIRLRR